MKLYRIWALMLKYYYVSINSMDRMFDVFYWPLLDIFIWGFMTYYINKISEVNIISVIMGGVVLWLFVWRAGQDIAIYVLEDFWSRSLYHMFTTPVTRVELLVSLFLVAIIRAFISFLALMLFAFILYKVNILAMGFMNFAIFVSILMIFGWSIGLAVSGVIFKFGHRVQVFAWSIAWIIQPFSCVFYPLDSLPLWIQSIAKLLPPTHVFEAMRAVLWGNPVNWAGVGYSAVSSMVFFILGGAFMLYGIECARKKGSIAKSE